MTGSASCYYTEEWKTVWKRKREISLRSATLAMKRRQDIQKKGLADLD